MNKRSIALGTCLLTLAGCDTECDLWRPTVTKNIRGETIGLEQAKDYSRQFIDPIKPEEYFAYTEDRNMRIYETDIGQIAVDLSEEVEFAKRIYDLQKDIVIEFDKAQMQTALHYIAKSNAPDRIITTEDLEQNLGQQAAGIENEANIPSYMQRR